MLVPFLTRRTRNDAPYLTLPYLTLPGCIFPSTSGQPPAGVSSLCFLCLVCVGCPPPVISPILYNSCNYIHLYIECQTDSTREWNLFIFAFLFSWFVEIDNGDWVMNSTRSLWRFAVLFRGFRDAFGFYSWTAKPQRFEVSWRWRQCSLLHPTTCRGGFREGRTRRPL